MAPSAIEISLVAMDNASATPDDVRQELGDPLLELEQATSRT